MATIRLRRKCVGIIIVVMLTAIFAFDVEGMDDFIESPVVNPATKYCRDLGYEWVIEKTENGEIGVCKFPDGSTTEEWGFLKGKNSKNWSYCSRKGYKIKTLNESDKCHSIYSRDCAVCVLDDGSEVEVTELMESERHSSNVTSTTTLSTTITQPEPAAEGDDLINYVLGFVVILLIVFFIYSEYKRRERAEGARKRGEMIDWVGEQLRSGEDPQKLKTVVVAKGFEPELVDYAEHKL